jgi:hypothetical protein
MNRIVREHYPVARLPEDLREGLDLGADVTVVVEMIASRQSARDATSHSHGSPDLPITRLLEELRDQRASTVDPVERVRSARCEWDGRDDLHERTRRASQD